MSLKNRKDPACFMPEIKSAMLKSRAFVCGLFLCLSVIPCSGKIRFSDLDLSGSRLLFSAFSSGGGSANQKSLFMAFLDTGSLSMLSTFPEKMELVDSGKTLLVHNAFGTQQLPIEGGLPRSFPGFRAFGGLTGARVESSSASPNGRWLLYVEPSSHARGALVLLDSTTLKKTEVSFDVERPARYFPAVWSKDSRGFLYVKGGKIFFYSVVTDASPPEERFRIIGEGGIPSLFWGAGDVFYYVKSSAVYRIRSNELFARTLYSPFLELGEVAGKIPFNFDPNFDRFWISPDGLSLLLCKEGRNLFYYPLGIQSDTETDFASLPHLLTPQSGSRINVLWSPEGILTVLIQREGSASDTRVYRLFVKNTGTENSVFEALESPPFFDAALSPDGTKILFWGNDGLFMYDYRNWKMLSKLVAAPVYSSIWRSNSELIVGGERKIESFRLSGTAVSEQRLICLAEVSQHCFEADPASPSSMRICANSENTWYVTDGNSAWTVVRSPSLREASLASGSYRVYLEDRDAFFENTPMVRNLSSLRTFSLFGGGKNEEPFGKAHILSDIIPGRIPLTEESSLQGSVINHGWRGGRQVAVCFDLYDDASGLALVLDALNRFGLKATFFVNGEFIRRHPQAAKDLSLSGHEVASMFFALLNLSDARYRIDKTFLEQGLARNEDEYHKATGRELALLWHPPFYVVSKEITDAAAALGYRTIGRDTDARDWISEGDAKRLNITQLSPADMIDIIMDAKEGGSIIPIRLGQLEGGREDYLFNSLEVLLDALLREGFDPVPVSTLIR